MKSKKYLIIALPALIVILVLVLVYINFSDKELVESPSLPKELWPRVITTEDLGGGVKLVMNKFDGYSITVPSEWLVNSTTSPQDVFRIYSEPQDEAEHSIQGIVLNIITTDSLEKMEQFTPEGTEFNKIEMKDYTAYKASSYEEEENAGAYMYIFIGDKKYYLVTCAVFENPNIQDLLNECEKQAKTFELIN